jgi:AraC-like DNA-binding protein
MYMVRSGATAGLEKLVWELGGNPIELIHSVGLRQSQFRDPDAYIAYHKLAELMEHCARLCDAPQFGLLLAERQTSSVLGDLPVIASPTNTVGEALTTVAKYLYLHASGVHMKQEQRGSLTRLGLNLDFTSALGTDQLLQLSVGHLATFTADLLRAERFSLTLHFRQPPPEGATAARRPLFNRLKFGEEYDGIAVESHQLQSRYYQDETALREHFRNYLQQLQNRYPGNLRSQVRDIIGRLLPVGECSIERVAATLNMHPRSLQMRLRENRLSYRGILRETRRELAEQRLRQGSVSITELALQLGYAEVAVFSRHFKQWSGMSPREWQISQRLGER